MNFFRRQKHVLEALLFGSLLFGAVSGSLRAQDNLRGTHSPGTGPRPGSADDQASAAMRRKLTSIIIPSIEFRATTVADAVEFLRQESVRLDRDPDPQKRGINIVLRLPAASQPAPPTAAPASAASGAGSSAGSLPGSPVPSARTRVTLTMSHIPLLEALKYVASQAGLKVRVEAYAVSLVPLTEDTDKLVTATFHVAPDFIENISGGGGKTVLDQAATTAQ